MFKKDCIFVFIFDDASRLGPLFCPQIASFYESVQKGGSEMGPHERTDARTESNGRDWQNIFGDSTQ